MIARRNAAREANSLRMARWPKRSNGCVMTGATVATTGATGTGSGADAGVAGGVFKARLRRRRNGVVGKGGGVGGGSPDAANRRPTTKIAIPPKMNGVSVTGA
ncbi:MAG: hypothetical protein RL492_824 [Verrucomicrobiota bacterium]